MPDIHSVAVFCGAASGTSPTYHDAAENLGRGLAQASMRVVYGGGRVGLMGAVANGALAAGGQVIGVIPEFLTQWEVAHEGVSELIVTDSMHSRKRCMFDLSDAFVTLPGGLGTLDETVEIITWRQLKLHDKPILICNIDGSANHLVAAVDHFIANGFARSDVRRLFEVLDGVPATLARLTELTTVRGGAAALM